MSIWWLIFLTAVYWFGVMGVDQIKVKHPHIFSSEEDYRELHMQSWIGVYKLYKRLY